MKVHELAPQKGSKKRRTRVGRGTGGHGGKTAGRGTKGQTARNKVPSRFEGGQTPLYRTSPKAKGFKNPFRIEYVPVNLDTLNTFDAGSEIDPAALRARGLIKKKGLVKVLARGTVDRKLTVRVHACSSAARKQVEDAGGRVELLPKPFGGRRPPASGNALMNR